ncbi:MAG: beta-ketoacyl-ACP synthase III [Planctomycetota bacterium]
MYECRVSGTGACLPDRRLTNFDLEKMVDTSDDWIVRRTGIRERRIAAPGECTSDLALGASRAALERAGLDARDLDVVILCTISPDTYVPAGASHLSRKLGLTTTAAFDLNAACTGFVYGVAAGAAMVRSGLLRNALVVGAEVLSRLTDYEDRATCILFGDGAGAAVLSRCEAGCSSRIVDSYLCADGNGASLIELPAGGSRMPASAETVAARAHCLKMQGGEVFKFATRALAELIEAALERNRLRPEDIDIVVPHQVNYRIIEAALKKVPVPMEKFYLNLERYGNTSAASVPIGLAEAVEEGRIRKGDTVLLVAFGAGLTWGYNLIIW